jgi:hypothetical protein
LIQISSENGKGVIIICKICGQYTCPSSCPEFNGYLVGVGASIGECELCGTRVYDDGQYYSVNGKKICFECAEEIVSPDLLDLLDCADMNEFFEMLQ